MKSTLVPCVLSATSLSFAVEFLKRASSLDCIAHELSAWSLLIVSILFSRFHNFILQCRTIASFPSCPFWYVSRALCRKPLLLPTSAVIFLLLPLPRWSNCPGSGFYCIVSPFLAFVDLFRFPSFFLSICSNFAIKSPSSKEVASLWLAVVPLLLCSSSCLALLLLNKLFQIFCISRSFVPPPPSLLVSFQPSLQSSPWTTFFFHRFRRVTRCVVYSIIWRKLNRLLLFFFHIWHLCWFRCFPLQLVNTVIWCLKINFKSRFSWSFHTLSFVLCSFALPVLTLFTEKFFLITFGSDNVLIRCDELWFLFESWTLLSAIGTLLHLMIFIYNFLYLQY